MSLSNSGAARRILLTPFFSEAPVLIISDIESQVFSRSTKGDVIFVSIMIYILLNQL